VIVTFECIIICNSGVIRLRRAGATLLAKLTIDLVSVIACYQQLRSRCVQ
jgi:hypothetical protein